MPAKSKAQLRFMRACGHGADYESCPEMSSKQYQDYMRSGARRLPERASKKKRKAKK